MIEMFGLSDNEGKKQRIWFFQYASLWSLIPLLWIVLYISGLAPCNRGELADSDCYMRLLRVEELHNGGIWYDPVAYRSNAPYGETTHWTRPLDVLLLLGAVPASLVTDFRSSLFWWGVVISPFLLCATTLILPWSLKPLLGIKGSFSAGFIFLCQITLLICFQPGRPDHQSLLIFLLMLSIGYVVHIIIEPLNIRFCYIAGLISTLAMWINVESMLPVGITIATLGFLWIWQDEDYCKKSLHYVLSLFIFTGVSLLLERAWQTLFIREYDRLSVVHLGMFGFVTIFWIVMFIVNRRTQFFHRRANRFLSVPVCIALFIFAILVFFPKFFKGPFADLDPRIARLWLKNVAEMQPLLTGSGHLAVSVQLIGSVLISLGLLIYLLFFSPRSEQLKGWIYVFLMLTTFTCLALIMYRWSYYAQAVVVVPMAEVMNRTLAGCKKLKNKFLMISRNILIKMAFILGLLFLGITVDIIFSKNTESSKKVSLISMCKFLNEADIWQKQKLRILTHIHFGEEVLYRTRHEVIGTPTATGAPHRSGGGILDTFDIMMAETDEQALQIIQKRQIRLILICPEYAESRLYSGKDQTSSFYQRLLDDATPSWLRKIELPADLSSTFKLFEITN
jgi:hypothetical protein